MQHVVSVFGSGVYDGVRASVFLLGSVPTTSMMQELAQRNMYPRNLFLLPAIGRAQHTTTPTYHLRCFSKNSEVEVPPFSAFAAAHPLLARHCDSRATSFVIFEGSLRLEFPLLGSGQLQCTVPLAPIQHWNVSSMERLLIRDLFGIVRRGIILDYIGSCQTLVVYDSESSVDQLLRLSPRPAPYTKNTVDQLDVDTIIVCISDNTSGGLLARAFQPAQDYAELPMPTNATPYLYNHWDPDSTMFEIAWVLMDKRCHIVKKTDHKPNRTVLIAHTSAV